MRCNVGLAGLGNETLLVVVKGLLSKTRRQRDAAIGLRALIFQHTVSRSKVCRSCRICAAGQGYDGPAVSSREVELWCAPWRQSCKAAGFKASK